ncbi:F-box/LRR-repeat protein 3, partial [Cucurbita argyrosperma subsp. argyrosperma]
MSLINLSYCSVTDVGLLSLASINCLRNMTILHLAGLTPDGLTAALLVCGGLRKVKLHLAAAGSPATRFSLAARTPKRQSRPSPGARCERFDSTRGPQQRATCVLM